MDTLNLIFKDNYAIIELDNGKVNAINVLLLKELNGVFTDLEANTNVKGVILTGKPNRFSAGLDVVALSEGGIPMAKAFWSEYHSLCLKMIKFNKPLVCAITGYAPAGGTILALCSDYRIMARGDKHVMGLHEFKMNMQLPEIFCDIYGYYLGENKAWQAIQRASLFNSDQALDVGLVNESCDVEQVLPKAEKHLQKMMQLLPSVFYHSKMYMRKKLISIVERDLSLLSDEIVTLNDTPEAKEIILRFANSLKRK